MSRILDGFRPNSSPFPNEISNIIGTIRAHVNIFLILINFGRRSIEKCA